VVGVRVPDNHDHQGAPRVVAEAALVLVGREAVADAPRTAATRALPEAMDATAIIPLSLFPIQYSAGCQDDTLES
jgi:hypothetical protein